MRLLLFLTLIFQAGGQTRRAPLFRSSARRVVVDVFVSQNGRPVSGLTAGDFQVLDDGEPQKGVTLLNTADEPLSAVLLIDMSASVRGQKLQQSKRAARAFVDGLSRSDEIAVIAFATQYELIQPMTKITQEAISSLERLRGGGATALHDSLHAATVHAESGTGRPLVVVFSDGDDNSSWLTMDDLVAGAEASSAVIYAVRVSSGTGLTLLDEKGRRFVEISADYKGTRALTNVVRAAGGRLISLRSTENLADAYAVILEEMRNRYLLVYEPVSNEPGYHRLDVELHRKKGELRARPGYFLREQLFSK